MVHLKLTFGDIMQSNILFYDSVSEAACFDICNYLKIDNMPGISGVDYYELKDDKFHQKVVTDELRVLVTDYIFDDNLLKQFEQNRHNVLFVYEEDVLAGVVHLSDYNRDVVLQYIQDDLLSFERKLRQLILLNGYTNEDMRNHFEEMSIKDAKAKEFYINKIGRFDKNKQEIDSMGPFQLFEFTDLMSFAHRYGDNPTHKFSDCKVAGEMRTNIEILRLLRNMAMHGKNPIGRDAETLIYSLGSFETLLDSLKTLRFEHSKIVKKIRNHPDFLKSIELENRSKLEIIHDHHPKALQYFLGF